MEETDVESEVEIPYHLQIEETDVDQWAHLGKSAYEIIRFHGFLPAIPTVVGPSGLTFVKSREKFRHEQRLLPEECYAVFDEKSAGPVYLSPPVEIGKKCHAYFKGGSSQHMSTILEGIAEIGVNFNDIQFLVASETLHMIASSVFKQSRSWRLRAYLEIIEGQKVIVVCNDDLDEIELVPMRDARFVKERRESINFAQSLCERYKGRNTNHFLHGNRVVVSSLTHRNSTVNMLVVGEMDMATDKQPLNAAVFTGRPNRVCLGNDEEKICDSFEYLWSRCFWIGISTCIIGMRSEADEPVKAIHRFDIRDFAQKHRGHIKDYHDIATTCVAQVMICLRDAFQTRPNVNWIIEYEGRPEEIEPNNIKVKAASDSYSLWQVFEEYHTAKLDYTKRQQSHMSQEKERSEQQGGRKRPIVNKQHELHNENLVLKIPKLENPETPYGIQLKEAVERKIQQCENPTDEVKNQNGRSIGKTKKIKKEPRIRLTNNRKLCKKVMNHFEMPFERIF